MDFEALVQLISNFGVSAAIIWWFMNQTNKKDDMLHTMMKEFNEAINNNTKVVELLKEELQRSERNKDKSDKL